MTQDEIDALAEDLGVFARRLHNERVGPHLGATAVHALGHLDRHGPMTAKSLARLERVTPQSIAKTVATLEAGGLVSRRSDPSDGRAHLIDLTDAGASALHNDRRVRNRWFTEAVHAECTDAERDLLLIAGRILRRVGNSNNPPP
ncbi:MarR family transcriptional regulator [Rhodococcus sp. KBS0724]|uniref:MarR family winged helix-turn-helix transcriptional regulator n=1 Tax=Rhodococcus sp. KBS0724 TaxID=1179674 RepID=UPI00110DD6E8|nr:MarR family transcriptional regulator [Rhodococcus sp. KBS0724]TSD45653.1 MarR family transcriptional regulator [Rhodococcus sp. KBS0724]